MIAEYIRNSSQTLATITRQKVVGNTFLAVHQFLHQRLQGRAGWTALAFTVLLLLSEMVLFEVDYLTLLQSIFTGGATWLTIASLLSILTTFIFVWASLLATRILRYLYFGIFAFAVFFEYTHHKVLGRFSMVQDVYTALLFNESELWQDSILAYFSFAAFIPVSIYAILVAQIKPRRTYGAWLFGLVFTTMIGLNALYFTVDERFPSASLGAFFRTAVAAPLDWAATYRGPRETVQFRAETKPTTNIVFVVDESVRADHLSINGYHRATTPVLEEAAQQNLLYSWGAGVAGTTCSKASNNLLLTGLVDLPDPQERLKRMPSIFQYAQAMGYKTFYLDSSSNRFWNGTADDRNYIDLWQERQQFETGPATDVDFALAAKIADITSGSVGNFIWVNKRGLHFHYNNVYPATEAVWTPVLETSRLDPNRRAEMVNAYDNALRYNLNNFFRPLLSPDVLADTTVVYTSDHGQTLSQNGEHWTHCNETPNEAKVPIILLTSRQLEIDPAYKARHANLFATLLDLMEFPTAERNYNYALSLLKAEQTNSEDRYYFVGNLKGRGDGRWYNFDGGGTAVDAATMLR